MISTILKINTTLLNWFWDYINRIINGIFYNPISIGLFIICLGVWVGVLIEIRKNDNEMKTELRLRKNPEFRKQYIKMLKKEQKQMKNNQLHAKRIAELRSYDYIYPIKEPGKNNPGHKPNAKRKCPICGCDEVVRFCSNYLGYEWSDMDYACPNCNKRWHFRNYPKTTEWSVKSKKIKKSEHCRHQYTDPVLIQYQQEIQKIMMHYERGQLPRPTTNHTKN